MNGVSLLYKQSYWSAVSLAKFVYSSSVWTPQVNLTKLESFKNLLIASVLFIFLSNPLVTLPFSTMTKAVSS